MPAELERTGDFATVEAKLPDQHRVVRLDARNVVRLSLAEDGNMVGTQDTARAPRTVQVYNGRAQIPIKIKDRGRGLRRG